MRLNAEKCKVMRFGKSNPKANYKMADNSENEINREETKIKKDLDVNVGYDLKSSGHVDRMVGKAKRTTVNNVSTDQNQDLVNDNNDDYKDKHVHNKRLELTVQQLTRKLRCIKWKVA